MPRLIGQFEKWKHRRSPLNRPYPRLGRIDEFELDRGLTENADDGGLLAAFPHAGATA
jgi:hypothetical protein